MCIRKVALWIVAISVSSAAVLEAQPGGRRGGMGGGIAPEQIFALLAFDEKFKVTDKQLPALRQALTPLYVERQQMLAEMFSGEVDFRAMREKMREQQTKMRDKIHDRARHGVRRRADRNPKSASTAAAAPARWTSRRWRRSARRRVLEYSQRNNNIFRVSTCVPTRKRYRYTPLASAIPVSSRPSQVIR